MSKVRYLSFIIVLVLGVVLMVIMQSYIYLLLSIVYILYEYMRHSQVKKMQKKKSKNALVDDFHLYLKGVILLSYTRPLKNAFKDSALTSNHKLNKKLKKFIEDTKYDFSSDPYKKLALSVNKDKKGINYELNIMYLLYEVDKRGLGVEFISDVLLELDSLIENKRQIKIEEIKEEAYKYNLPPTIINFIYVSLILFQVINQIIMDTLQL